MTNIILPLDTDNIVPEVSYKLENNTDVLIRNYTSIDEIKLVQLYKTWLEFGTLCTEYGGRKPNIPEVLTENLVCYLIPDILNVNKSTYITPKGSSYDAIDNKGNLVQIKATSIEKDLTSFGPRTKFDRLIFVKVSYNINEFYIYEIEPNNIYDLKITATQTFKDQQNEGRRPRFSIIKTFIDTKRCKFLYQGKIDVVNNCIIEIYNIDKTTMNYNSESSFNSIKVNTVIKPRPIFNIINKANSNNTNTNKNLRLADFYAGVGGFSTAFSNLGVSTVYAIDSSKECKITFDANHTIQCTCQDIQTLQINPTNDVPTMDILTAGFNCQPFSVAGERKGFEDSRTNSLWVMFDIIKEKKPKCVFFENVKGLLTHNNGQSFNVILEKLRDAGYNKIFHELLNTSTHTDIPQNRERLFIVAFHNNYSTNIEKFEFPKPILYNRSINEFLQDDSIIPEKYFYTEKSKIYSELRDNIVDDAVYQYRRGIVRRNQSGVVPTLVATMGTGGHNVPIIKTNRGIRKLTPRECFNFQGYDETFILPNLADSHLYKQAGNGVTMTLVRKIAEEIVKLIQ